MRWDDAHEQKLCRTGTDCVAHPSYRSVIVLFGVCVYREHRDDIIVSSLALIPEKKARKGDCPKRIPPGRLRYDPYRRPGLGPDLFILALSGGDDRAAPRELGRKEAQCPLQHRFPATLSIGKEREELFRSDLIGERPEPFA
jgi:hypothetical protein